MSFLWERPPIDELVRSPGNASRFSSETQRRNGRPGSRNPDLGLRIDENLSFLNYDCAICIDVIAPTDAMWDCKTCFQVFHHTCIRQWARNGNALGVGNWDCPTCKHTRNRLPESTCWCTSQPSSTIRQRNNLVRNSCLGHCGRPPVNACPHSHTCQKICHAGPCTRCPRCPIPDANAARNPVPNPVPNGAHAVIQNGALNAPPRVSNGGASCCAVFLLVPINIALIIWLNLYIKRVTQPYNHQDWIFGGFVDHHVWLLIFVLAPLIVANGLCAFGTVYVPRRPGAPQIGVFSFLWRLLFVVFMVLWPLCSFIAGPDGTWYNTMKNTCDGFDTRVTLDDYRTYNMYQEVMSPNATLFLHSPGKEPVLPPLHIGTHITHTNRPSDPYQFFFRISGSTPATKHISVDFDFDNFVWRMLHLNETDHTNTWSAGNSTNGRTSPVHHHHHHNHHQKSIPSAILVKNGTWSSTSEYYRSLVIPELDLQIPHFWEFTQSCAFEPFLKVHRTSGMTAREIQEQADKEWNKGTESTVVMRTAGFGHGQQAIDVCIKNEDFRHESSWKKLKGLGDDMLVPLGLLESYRLRLYNENLRSFCYFGGGFKHDGKEQKILT